MLSLDFRAVVLIISTMIILTSCGDSNTTNAKSVKETFASYTATTDKNHWAKIVDDEKSYNKITITDDGTIFVTAADWVEISKRNNKRIEYLYRSNDGGLNWTDLRSTLYEGEFASVEVESLFSKGNCVYMLVDPPFEGLSTAFFSVGTEEEELVLRSCDGGETWENLIENWDAEKSGDFIGRSDLELGITPTEDIYMTVGRSYSVTFLNEEDDSWQLVLDGDNLPTRKIFDNDYSILSDKLIYFTVFTEESKPWNIQTRKLLFDGNDFRYIEIPDYMNVDVSKITIPIHHTNLNNRRPKFTKGLDGNLYTLFDNDPEESISKKRGSPKGSPGSYLMVSEDNGMSWRKSSVFKEKIFSRLIGVVNNGTTLAILESDDDSQQIKYSTTDQDWKPIEGINYVEDAVINDFEYHPQGALILLAYGDIYVMPMDNITD